MTKILITGITGQDGYYLAQEALSKGYDVFGMVRGQDNPRLSELKTQLPEVTFLEGDLLDKRSIRRCFQESEPYMVFNLAAVTYVPFSWDQPELTFEINAIGVQHLLDVCEEMKTRAFVQASTSEMYGGTVGNLNEDSKFQPKSPYAIAKLAAHHLCVSYRKAGKVNATSLIMFNHESPRRGSRFVTRTITQGLARVKMGLQDHILLGNVSAVRDWGYAPEYMKVMLKVGEVNLPRSEYMLATGESATVAQFAQKVCEYADLDYESVVRIDESRLRVNEVQTLRADPYAILKDIGWQATVKWPQIAEIMFNHDMKLVANNA